MLLYFIIFILRKIDVFNFLLIQNRIFIGLHHKVRIDALGNKRISAYNTVIAYNGAPPKIVALA
jgi:hypothetical protein